MFAMFASKNLKYGLFALVVVMAMLFSKVLPLVYIMIPIAVFSNAIFGVFDYNKNNQNNFKLNFKIVEERIFYGIN